ncbi:uncharacterized protein LOC125499363 [Beta vulgaris subsp. vulgaris]|uniref:uncharacterized protein LOC125499363 n=1 Tax=Beta vulgaris subsp. vulgaris TaxID=3555 RepID=UPI0025490FCA|nr:uncharacterized protein LOC125499363 [Beta vulgaris subsp. vulgaris]
MEAEATSERVTLDNDDDDDDDADSTIVKGKNPAIETTSEGLEPPMKKAKVLKNPKGKEKIPKERRKDETQNLSVALLNVSSNFGKIFGDMSSNLATMAYAWSKAEEREQLKDDKSNNVLEEVMKLEVYLLPRLFKLLLF